jgi:hypothetical protein
MLNQLTSLVVAQTAFGMAQRLQIFQFSIDAPGEFPS